MKANKDGQKIAPGHSIGVSPWAPDFSSKPKGVEDRVFEKTFRGFLLRASLRDDSLWVQVVWPKGNRVCFRPAFFPGGIPSLFEVVTDENSLLLRVDSSIGRQSVKISFLDSHLPLLRYTTTLRCNVPSLIPFWPRDIVPLSRKGSPLKVEGTIHAAQKGPRSGLLHVSLPHPLDGSFFYFQNLTALSDYCEATQSSVANTVGGAWPELGFALPTTREKPLREGKDFIISDALIVLNARSPRGEIEIAKQFLNSLAEVYLHLKLPPTHFPDWPAITKKSLNDLETCPGCWTHLNGHDYLNAYVCDYKTPPESMVQLSVLVPLLEYTKWAGHDLPIIKRIEDGLGNFFDPKIGCVGRWLPETEEKLSGSEEQKKPRVMDSWYQLHTLLNLSRMALHGNKTAKKLFLDSIGYAVKVARHFKYRWPVFYNVDTLEVIKAETKPGEGGEKDVPGSYAHVMLQAWELTKENRYLAEAQRAAKALRGAGMKLLYQANNTAFAAGALLKLWKITRNNLFLDLSYLCMANLFKNVWLWEGKYGYGKAHSTFFALFPLEDAPYTAVYEEQEVFSALSKYIVLAEGEQILSSVRLLVAEFIRYVGYRATLYYPPLLPNEMLSDKVKTGDVDRRLWIPIEDMHEGGEKSGEVGQEVYGAGQAFGFLTRHFLQVPSKKFMIYVDYPRIIKLTQSASRVCLMHEQVISSRVS